jgi:hypothetical protein
MRKKKETFDKYLVVYLSKDKQTKQMVNPSGEFEPSMSNWQGLVSSINGGVNYGFKIKG